MRKNKRSDLVGDLLSMPQLSHDQKKQLISMGNKRLQKNLQRVSAIDSDGIWRKATGKSNIK